MPKFIIEFKYTGDARTSPIEAEDANEAVTKFYKDNFTIDFRNSDEEKYYAMSVEQVQEDHWDKAEAWINSHVDQNV